MEEFTLIPQPVDIKTRSSLRASVTRFPFKSLTPGIGFVVSGDHARKNSCRSSVRQYNARNGTSIFCKALEDGSIYVGMPTLPAQDIAPEIQHPTQFELISHIASLKVGQSFDIGTAWKDRYAEFRQWIADMGKNSGIEATVSTTALGMTITRTK